MSEPSAPQTPDREQEIRARAEGLALAVWEKCTRGEGGCVYDDPRNIAAAALPVLDAAVAAAVRRALEDAADAAHAEGGRLYDDTGLKAAEAAWSVATMLRDRAAAVASPARERDEAYPVEQSEEPK